LETHKWAKQVGKVSFGVAGLAELGNLGWSKDFEHVDGQEDGKSNLRVAKYHRELGNQERPRALIREMVPV